MMKIKLICLILLLSSCQSSMQDDIWRYNARPFLQDILHIPYPELLVFQHVKTEENPIETRYSWFRLSDTNDSIFISVSAGKDKDRYVVANPVCSPSINMLIMKGQNGRAIGRFKRTLSNLFDESVVDSAHVKDYITLAPNDSIDWLLDKEKIALYIAKGYYTVEQNLSEPHILSFYNYVAIDQKRNIKYLHLSVYFKESHQIELRIEPSNEQIRSISKAKRLSKVDEVCVEKRFNK